MTRLGSLAALAVVLACGDDKVAASGSETDATTGDGGETTSDGDTTTDSGQTTSGGGGTESEESTTAGFVPQCEVHDDCRIDCQTCDPVPGAPEPCDGDPCPTPVGCYAGECVFLSDCDEAHATCGRDPDPCPPGEVQAIFFGCHVGCVPEQTCYQHDGSTKNPGDPCRPYGPQGCGPGLLCWDVDQTTLEGACVETCEAPDWDCTDPTEVCIVGNDGGLSVCVSSCDPLEQNCPGQQGCYLINASLVCAPGGAGPGAGSYAQECSYPNGCDPGLMCVNAWRVPGCTTAQCCTTFCDTTGPNLCPDAVAGQTCVSLFDPAPAPMGRENVGVCSL